MGRTLEEEVTYLMSGKYLGKGGKFIVNGTQWSTWYLVEKVKRTWTSNPGHFANEEQ